MNTIRCKAEILMANWVMIIVKVISVDERKRHVLELSTSEYPGDHTLLHKAKGEIVDILVTSRFYDPAGQWEHSATWAPPPDDPPIKAELV